MPTQSDKLVYVFHPVEQHQYEFYISLDFLLTATGFNSPVEAPPLMFSSSLGVHRQTGDIDSILQSILPVCSYDGVPFLMHDLTLQRTTNVHEVFPNRTDAPASMFTWAELERLNAGAWFLSVSCHS